MGVLYKDELWAFEKKKDHQFIGPPGLFSLHLILSF